MGDQGDGADQVDRLLSPLRLLTQPKPGSWNFVKASSLALPCSYPSLCSVILRANGPPARFLIVKKTLNLGFQNVTYI